MFFVLLSLALGQKRDTPGFAFLGSGYDLVFGNPLATDGMGDPGYRQFIFDWKYTQKLGTSDLKYRLADKTHARTFDDCTTTMDETMYNSAYGYKKLIDTAVGVNLG